VCGNDSTIKVYKLPSMESITEIRCDSSMHEINSMCQAGGTSHVGAVLMAGHDRFAYAASAAA